MFSKSKNGLLVVVFSVYETINIHLELPNRCIHEHIMSVLYPYIMHWHYRHELC